MRELTQTEIERLRLSAIKKKTGKLRCAIYARKSAEDKKQISLPMQESLCKELIAKYDFFEYTKTYQEDDKSGMFADNRLELQAMISAVEAGEIDVVVVMKLDRLARDLVDAGNVVKLLNAYHCFFIAGDDISDTNTPEGEFMRNILMAQNQFYARRIASDVMRGECHNVEKGNSTGGRAPYGLKVVAKKFEIDETEAPAIRIAFSMCAKGRSYQEIQTELTRLGYTTRQGERFSYSTLNSLLRNEKYYGEYIYNRDDGKKRKRRVRLEEDFKQIHNSKAIPPIISKALFDEVQAILKNRMQIRPKQNSFSDYVLTGLLWCKQCQSPMSGTSQTGGRNKTKYRTYICPQHIKRNGGQCTTKPINAEYLERVVKIAILESVNDYIASDSFSVSVIDELKHETEENISILNHRIAEIDYSIRKLIKQLENITNSFATKEIENQIAEYSECKGKKAGEIETLNKRLKAIEDIKNCFKNNKSKIKEEDLFATNQDSREVIGIFIKKIVIDEANDDIEIEFNV